MYFIVRAACCVRRFPVKNASRYIAPTSSPRIPDKLPAILIVHHGGSSWSAQETTERDRRGCVADLPRSNENKHIVTNYRQLTPPPPALTSRARPRYGDASEKERPRLPCRRQRLVLSPELDICRHQAAFFCSWSATPPLLLLVCAAPLLLLGMSGPPLLLLGMRCALLMLPLEARCPSSAPAESVAPLSCSQGRLGAREHVAKCAGGRYIVFVSGT